MIKTLIQKINNSTLTSKIRYSYFLFIIPVVIFIFLFQYGLKQMNTQYEEMIETASVASDFSLDFKSDFDYETYLVIVGNKTIEESDIYKLLKDAETVVDQIEHMTDSSDNKVRLQGVKKYIGNLYNYISNIENNLSEPDKYEENMEIWENDVQIVTSLISESMSQYLYYEIRDIEASRQTTQEYYNNMVTVFVVAMMIIIVLMLAASAIIPQSITSPIRELNKVTNQVSNGNLEVRANVKNGVEVKQLSDSLNIMIDKINQLLEQVKEEQISLREAELELLQAQINPHFLYNTLDTIVWLAEAGDQKQVVSMVESLSDFFRISLNQGQDIISIKNEIQHVRSYLEIQQIRYRDILEYEINVDEELSEYLIPKITLQPLVENALYHGIKNKRGMGKIVICSKNTDDGFALIVSDNGKGMQPEELEHIRMSMDSNDKERTEVFGLHNVNERIKLKFGDKYGIEIDSTYMEGTTVTINLPNTR